MERERELKIKHNKRPLYYSMLTIFLLACVLHIGFSFCKNITKIVSYQGKKMNYKQIYKQANLRKFALLKEISECDETYQEAFLRENLKMAEHKSVQKKPKNDNFLRFFKHDIRCVKIGLYAG